MNEGTLFEHVRVVAEAVLDRLGDHASPWQIIGVGWTPDSMAQQRECGLVITLSSRYYGESRSLPEPAAQSQVSVVLGSPNHGHVDSVTA